MRAESQTPARQRGIVMISSLLLLLVLTLIAISMFRSFGLEERIAGNLREKNRALQAAMSAQQYAEWWLTQGNNVNNVQVCTTMLNANISQGAVCSNQLNAIVANVATVPWVVGGQNVGVSYTPDNMLTNAANGGVATGNSYSSVPVFYISKLGAYPGGNGEVYQIDAVGYGATQDAVAVVESTFLVSNAVKNLETQ